ncbi:hypothetical protein C0J52_25850 [Blattella germanica]|nr:hypothetical protein C0J52_25850 [Blattella germanica]
MYSRGRARILLDSMSDDDHKYSPLLGDYEHGGVIPRFCLNKTPLERKLIALTIVLGLTTFCLIIAVAVLDHKYHDAEMHTSTVAPPTTTTPMTTSTVPPTNGTTTTVHPTNATTTTVPPTNLSLIHI